MQLPVGLRAAGHRTDTGLKEGREQLACAGCLLDLGGRRLQNSTSFLKLGHSSESA